MTYFLASAGGAAFSLLALYLLGRNETKDPHPALGPISSVLISGFAALTWFLVAAGWAASWGDHPMPPRPLYKADVVLGLVVLLWPPLALLPFDRRNGFVVSLFGAVVGYSVALAWALGQG